MKTRWTIELAVLLLIAPMGVGSAPSVAAAQPAQASAGDSDPNELFRRGYQLYDQGKLAEAIALWEKALTLLPPERGGKLRYNLGLAYEQMGDATRAAENYTAFLAWIASTTETLAPEYEERRVDAAARLRGIKEKHGALVFQSQPARVTVSIDGGEPRAAGFTAYVTEGAHRVVVAGPTGATREQSVDARAGSSQDVDTHDPTPPPAPLPAPMMPQPQPEPRSFPLIPVLVGVGLTGAGFALPGVMHGRAEDARAAAEQLGRGHTGYAGAKSEFESRRRSYNLSYLLPAGLGLATLGVTIYGIVYVSTGQEPVSGEPASALVAAPLEGGGALWWRGRF